MDIYKLLDLLETIERGTSDLYRALQEQHRTNKEAADFFLNLHLEEEAHVQIVRMERRIVKAAPKAFVEPQVNLSEINSLLESIQDLKAQRLELPDVIARIYTIESCMAEKYLIDALKDTNDEIRDFLLQLGGTCSVHFEKVAAFARTLGVQSDEIENRALRKPRVPYPEKVTIDGSLSVRAVDISEGGMFLLTGRNVPEGATVSLQFSLHHVPIRTDAVVQFVLENLGIGLQFSGLQDRNRELIAQYVLQRIEERGLEKQKRVLLVGGARQNGREMRMYMHELIAAGFKVVEVSGFEDALQFLKKRRELDGVVFSIESETDINYYLLNFLCTMDFYQGLRMLVLSNNQGGEFREALTRKGVLPILPRLSTSPKRLAEVLRTALS
jgi:hypothetical protein